MQYLTGARMNLVVPICRSRFKARKLAEMVTPMVSFKTLVASRNIAFCKENPSQKLAHIFDDSYSGKAYLSVTICGSLNSVRPHSLAHGHSG